MPPRFTPGKENHLHPTYTWLNCCVAASDRAQNSSQWFNVLTSANKAGIGNSLILTVAQIKCCAGTRCFLRSCTMERRHQWLNSPFIRDIFPYRTPCLVTVFQEDLTIWEALLMGSNHDDPGLVVSDSHRNLSPPERAHYLRKLRELAGKLYKERKWKPGCIWHLISLLCYGWLNL